MTFALTRFEAYGVEAAEPLQNRFIQRAEFRITAANTDVDLDLGDYTGTFWTAVGATEPGITALHAMKDINLYARAFLSVEGTGLNGKTQSPASGGSTLSFLSGASVGGSVTETYTVTGLLASDTILSVTPEIASATGRPVITALTSAAYAGGSATPTLTVTGLLTTDTILGATQIAKNANSLPLIGAAATCAVNDQYAVVYSADPGATGTVRVEISRVATVDTYTPVSWNTQADNSLKVVYGANPGAGAKVLVSVARTVSAVPAGTYQITMDSTNVNLPNILFLSGDAPTVYDIVLQWEYPNGIVTVATGEAA